MLTIKENSQNDTLEILVSQLWKDLQEEKSCL